MTTVVNLQKNVSLQTALYRQFIKQIKTTVPEASGKTFTVAFIGDDRMRQLNELFRGKDATTDVLSFPHEPDEFDPDKNNLGDVVISADQAQKQAVENGLTFEIETKQLILHGLLHLCGYDHETDNGEMNERELVLRAHLDI